MDHSEQENAGTYLIGHLGSCHWTVIDVKLDQINDYLHPIGNILTQIGNILIVTTKYTDSNQYSWVFLEWNSRETILRVRITKRNKLLLGVSGTPIMNRRLRIQVLSC